MTGTEVRTRAREVEVDRRQTPSTGEKGQGKTGDKDGREVRKRGERRNWRKSLQYELNRATQRGGRLRNRVSAKTGNQDERRWRQETTEGY